MNHGQDIAKLHMSPEQWEEVRKCEYLAVRTLKTRSGLMSKPIAWGTREDCETPKHILLMPEGVEYIGDDIIRVADILPPDEGK